MKLDPDRILMLAKLAEYDSIRDKRTFSGENYMAKSEDVVLKVSSNGPYDGLINESDLEKRISQLNPLQFDKFTVTFYERETGADMALSPKNSHSVRERELTITAQELNHIVYSKKVYDNYCKLRKQLKEFKKNE